MEGFFIAVLLVEKWWPWIMRPSNSVHLLGTFLPVCFWLCNLQHIIANFSCLWVICVNNIIDVTLTIFTKVCVLNMFIKMGQLNVLIACSHGLVSPWLQAKRWVPKCVCGADVIYTPAPSGGFVRKPERRSGSRWESVHRDVRPDRKQTRLR